MNYYLIGFLLSIIPLLKRARTLASIHSVGQPHRLALGSVHACACILDFSYWLDCQFWSKWFAAPL